MTYSEEIVRSLLWIGRNLAITAVAFSIGIFLIVRFTHWGKQFWRFAGGYLSPRRSVKPILMFIVIVALTLLTVRVSLVHSEWYRNMYTSLQEFNEPEFWIQMWVFCAIATTAVINSLLTFYIEQSFSIGWIKWLNQELVEKWLSKRAYYNTQYMDVQLENPDQRIQQDVQSYVKISLTLSVGVINAVTSMISYTILLWGLAGPMEMMGYTIPHLMVYLVFAYVIVSTLIAFWLGKPLINLNFLNERLNANYRYSLIRIKEYAESIAFYMGEKVEKSLLYRQFNAVIKNMWDIVYRTLKFTGFNVVVGQTSVVFPLLIQAGRYFEKQIKLGELMQTMQVFGQLHANLSFFRTSYDEFAAYKATLDRLTGFVSVIEMAEEQSFSKIQHHETDVIFRDLDVKSPYGTTLIKGLNLQLHAGSRLLIQGKSGAGKTTLLRTAAGLWSNAEGEIFCPENNCLFLSQKPYLPQGDLLTALYYPQHADTVDLERVKQVLQQVQLGHLQEHLEKENDWTRILSLGEQQRLAFARLLLQQPKVAFLDEATASMDEGLEDAMYRLLASELPNTTIISVGHRSTLLQYHQQHLQILAGGEWKFTA